MRRRKPQERGATLIEMAIVAPIVLLIIFGVVETSFVFRSASVFTTASRAGARIAAPSYGDAQTPAERVAVRDAIVDAVEVGLDDLNTATTPSRLIIYKADTAGLPPSGDLDVCAARCIEFTWNTGTQQFDYAGGAWNDPVDCGDDLDRVGVYVTGTHDPFTAFFIPTLDIRERTTMRLEPGSRSTC